MSYLSPCANGAETAHVQLPAEIRCRDQGHTSQRQRARLLDANRRYRSQSCAAAFEGARQLEKGEAGPTAAAS